MLHNGLPSTESNFFCLLVQDGTILEWKYSAATNCFQSAKSLQRHSLAVVALTVGHGVLYSGVITITILLMYVIFKGMVW